MELLKEEEKMSMTNEKFEMKKKEEEEGYGVVEGGREDVDDNK